MKSFQVYNSFKYENDKKFVHRLEVGLGVKVPLGVINKTYETGSLI